jgi:glucokinase
MYNVKYISIHKGSGFVADKKETYFLAIDIGGSKIAAGIVDMRGNILSKHARKIPDGLNEDKNKLFELVFDLAQKAMDEAGDIEIAAAGAAIPGICDDKNGIWVYSPFSGIKNVPAAKIIGQKLGLKTFIANDVNACAYAEKVFSHETLHDYLWITVSNGIGGGLVLGGKLYEGAFGHAGEIGHVTVVEEGELCGCGKRGCLEAYASGASIVRRYKEKTGYPFDITAHEIASLAMCGDESAIEIYNFAGYCLGKAIAMAINLLNLKKVIIGGGVSGSLDLLMPKINETVRKQVFMSANTNLEIQKTKLGYDAALLGAAAIAQKGINRR